MRPSSNVCARARARVAYVCVRAPGRHGCSGGGRSQRRGTAARSAAARACRADAQRRRASSRPQRSRVTERPGGHPASAWGRCRGRRAWGTYGGRLVACRYRVGYMGLQA
eukprot:scaffold60316_cov33-Phaeocystis_antarctica.AAC.1